MSFFGRKNRITRNNDDAIYNVRQGFLPGKSGFYQFIYASLYTALLMNISISEMAYADE
ncbi:hypothetical protein Pcaca04_14500 [Pectobacterium carotovorum subsp. carotovorum]|nr:hypothetical protein Pcaca04_14500 [Pectobacterium carotovorum subsp. carotovorum]